MRNNYGASENDQRCRSGGGCGRSALCCSVTVKLPSMMRVGSRASSASITASEETRACVSAITVRSLRKVDDDVKAVLGDSGR